MPSTTPALSSTSAGARYLNRDRRLAELRQMAVRAVGRMPEIRRIVLFGSLAKGDATPRSDADLLVEVAKSAHDQPRDRIPELLGVLSPLPCPLDLFVYTSREIENLRADRSPLLREVDENGIRLTGPGEASAA